MEESANENKSKCCLVRNGQTHNSRWNGNKSKQASMQFDSSYKRKQENTRGTTTNTCQPMFIWKMDSHALLWRCWQCYLLIGMAISAPLSGAPQITLLGHSKPPHLLPSKIHPPGNPERNHSYFVLCIRLSFIFKFSSTNSKFSSS